MSTLFNKLSNLKNNLFGGPGNTGSTSPISRTSPIELANSNPLNSKLDGDPFQFTSHVYPSGMSDYKQEAQYIIFYINVNNHTNHGEVAEARDARKKAYDDDRANIRESYRGRVIVKEPNFDRPNMADIAGALPTTKPTIADVAGPIYKDAKEAATRPNIGQITGGIAAAGAAARPNIGDITGPAAAEIDSAAATRPTIAAISGGISDAAAAANQDSFRGRVTGAVAAASTVPARPSIADIAGAAATVAADPIRNFNMGDIAGGSATSTTPARPNIGQITGGYATPTTRPNMADIAGPLQQKLRVKTTNIHAGENYKIAKKQQILNSEGTDLALGKQESLSGMNSYANLTTRISESIALYLPSNIESTYGVQYNAAETGTLGFLAAAGARGLESFAKRDQEALAKLGVNVSSDLLSALATTGAAELMSALGLGEGGGALVNKFFGKATNPYMEVLFENPEMRTFTYSFNFTPKSAKETEDIKKIIELFRFHMAPEMQNDRSGRFMTLPAEFDIHYMYQNGDGTAFENSYMNKIATCVLTNCTVNYTPNGVQVHDDGSPVSINMQLSFQETEMITKEKIVKGF